MQILARTVMSCVVFAGALCSQQQSQFTVHILDSPAITMSVADLDALPKHSAILHDHGKEVQYEGVLVHDVLVKAGLDFGKELHGKQLSSYVEAIGDDGYRVVYSLAEFDPSVMDSDILIADKQDGHTLGEKQGPFRIVAPHDKRPARSLRLLHEISVVQLAK